jgi:ubiquinone biosynthesis protein
LLYPECRIWDEVKPFMEEIARMRLSPVLLFKEAQHELADTSRFLRLFPARLENLFRRIEEQKIAFALRHHGLESLTQSLENLSNRVSYSIIIGSLIIGSSLIITAGIGPLIFGFPLLGITGFIISGLMGIWLTIQMIKKKKL